MSLHNPACFANHIGVWLMQPTWLQQAVGAIKAGVWKAAAAPAAAAPPRFAGKVVADTASGRALYTVTNDGLAIISIEGPMMKMDSKYGGANTMQIRRAIRTAVADPDAVGIMLYMDTPGGHVAGTMELADDIRAAGKSKPVHAHADDLLASAGYWAASATSRISVNAIGEVGSIGVVGVIQDWSKAYEAAGVTVHVISTGSMKGAFTEGTPITPEQIAYLQKQVDDINAFFLAAVQKGRGMSAKKLAEIADGRVFIAAEALANGLVDGIESFDKSLVELKKAATSFAAHAKQSARAKQAAQRLEIEAAE
jgi:signal peptide peptidase SppA